MTRTQLLALASIYMDRANSADTDAGSDAWALAAAEMRAAAKGADIVAEHHIATGYCPTCGGDLYAMPMDACMDERHLAALLA